MPNHNFSSYNIKFNLVFAVFTQPSNVTVDQVYPTAARVRIDLSPDADWLVDDHVNKGSGMQLCRGEETVFLVATVGNSLSSIERLGSSPDLFMLFCF